ncbi:hypothetical protein GCM10020255_037370 [Rhodococcus baikonurensis]
MGDGGADLALDVVTDDRDAGVLELGSPLRVGSDEDGQSVDERNACVDRALCVELVSVVGTDRQVGNEDVDLSVLECLDDVDGLGVGQLDGLGVVLADAVEGRATLNGNVQGGTSAILMVLFSLARIASERSKPTFFASTSNAATNCTSRTWYLPNLTCMRPGTVWVSSASL